MNDQDVKTCRKPTREELEASMGVDEEGPMSDEKQANTKEHGDFVKELADLINGHSIENIANVPDFILAEHMYQSMRVFCSTAIRRDRWYGVHLEPGNKYFNDPNLPIPPQARSTLA